MTNRKTEHYEQGREESKDKSLSAAAEALEMDVVVDDHLEVDSKKKAANESRSTTVTDKSCDVLEPGEPVLPSRENMDDGMICRCCTQGQGNSIIEVDSMSSVSSLTSTSQPSRSELTSQDVTVDRETSSNSLEPSSKRTRYCYE